MAWKLLKPCGKRKVAAKRPAKKNEDNSVILVGTYREKQLEWIKKNGVYNYPVEDDAGRAGCPQPAALAQVPRPQLRVCEAAVQLDFFPVMGDCVSQNVPFLPLKSSKFTFVDMNYVDKEFFIYTVMERLLKMSVLTGASKLMMMEMFYRRMEGSKII